MASTQKVVLAPGATFGGNTVLTSDYDMVSQIT